MSVKGPTTTGTTSTNQTRDVNPALMPYLTDVMSQAKNLYGTGAGSNLYTGPTVSPLDPLAMQGITGMTNTALGQEGPSQIPYDYAVNNIASGGLSAQQQGELAKLAGISSGTGASSDVLSQMAGQGTSPTINPYLQSQLDYQNQLIANRINSQISGSGRYGSGGQADVLGRALAGATAPVIAGAYENQQNRALQAAQADIAARAGAAGAGLGAMQSGANTALGWAGLSPQLNSLMYDPSNRLLGIGGMLTDRSQQALNNQIALYNAQQQMPWTQLGRYVGAVGGTLPAFQGTGTTVGTGTVNQQQQVPWWSLLAGGSNSPVAGAANVGANILGMFA